MTDYGIDVSHWNTVTDWNAVRGNGIQYVSIKLTESTIMVDPAAGGHVAGARAAGIRPGGYHFARDLDVDAQADRFCDNLKRHGLLGNGSLVPMLDMEAAELRDNANSFVAAFIRRYRIASGQNKILIYANLDWWRNVLRPGEWADGDVYLWIARYNGNPGNPGWSHDRLALHQHTSKGTVPGVAGNVDRNATVGAFTLDMLTLGGTSAPPVPSPPPGPSDNTYTVVPGDTLSEIAARFGTTWQELQRINGIPDANKIFPGQVLRISGRAPAQRTYTVVRGDTLSGIAARFGATWQELQRINGIPDANKIFPGQVLRLP
ncbi:GH25 family lysozyme M1 (1,4-beta-N-acetylmuramidase) [Kibdelosporangium banguiense]|uniref:GH25 family lysozyme M1 (1,4-beta-N-acetylmuramidase) n=1 Tax=Kibdelosporangium banguiense TaxID=1365924 RepID=A0ABS4TN50_9PSEU|nr:LysM peptidoglycan-binding domain-containing protein [Kibdelosporangium banguiense]MBP2325316.1 GH25 family lysozyme M1 (1,4-beta-N-acetylmuramidase) [Kibdelosporangium banguiense]